ncbi:glycosyltransferase family protein [Falsiroseomonas selenitidurans]|uniref:hypothetical protein n=1 Tax=Falsiroseomonas selenitidurans TaxID=2716335 RepID=UPI001ADE2F53|nr:hypothetical protein [Falsiroseomonas selenitidurans]
MADVHAYTSFTYAYLSRARTLAASLRRRHPDWTLWAVMVDRPPPGFDNSAWAGEFDHVIDAEDLYPDGWSGWIFRHDIVEACTAVKGRALQHLLASGAEKVIYLDPDIAVFHDLAPIVRRLDTASIVLTPHQVEPNATDWAFADNEHTSMRYGIFNLGFLAVRNDATGRAMADWWAGCLKRACYDDVANGIFTDQKYCDHVPGLFPDVHVERDPGFNVASWNLSRRRLSIERGGDILVNGAPLRFYHFTKIGSAGDVMTDRYARGNLAVFEVWTWYKRAIASRALPGIPRGWWTYGTFSDGTPIPKAVRVLYRTRQDLMNHFTDPFTVTDDGFLPWLRVEAPALLA